MTTPPPHKYKATADSQPLQLESPPKVALIIVNPNSGQKKGPKALAVIKPIFEKAGIECKVYETSHAGHCGEICEKEDLTGIDMVVPIGGDGTLHEACNGLMARSDDAANRVTVAVIPAGSGNTFAFDLGILDAAQAANVAVQGKYRKIDLGKVVAVDMEGNVVENKRPIYSINMIGWALPSRVLKVANSLRFLGCGAWYNYAIRTYILKNDRYKANVKFTDAEGKQVDEVRDYTMLVVQNTIHLGDKLPLAPSAKVDDGLLDFCYFQVDWMLSNIITFDKAKTGDHVKRKKFFGAKVSEVTLIPKDGRLRGPNTVNIDGELVGPSPCRITVVPGAIRIFTPE